jgi:hypothetical protein
MSNALNTKILLAIMVAVVAIAGAVAWERHNTQTLQQKAQQQRKAFWDHYNSGVKNDPSVSWGSASEIQGYKTPQPEQKKAK